MCITKYRYVHYNKNMTNDLNPILTVVSVSLQDVELNNPHRILNPTDVNITVHSCR